ncbi:C39 family peptidase [Candidatus Daviesbacteria bacterium]|nr:C39 family peptidase [Candidatus Daviesbacteria bacterium]
MEIHNFRKLLWHLILFSKKFRYFFYNPSINSNLINIPYFKQGDTGAKTQKEKELWSKNGCGMACLKMILVHKLNKNIPIFKLGEKCIEYGGFIENKSSPDGLDGLFYKPFLNFIYKEFNLEGKIISPMVLEEIIENLVNKNYVIASVSSQIRNPQSNPTKIGSGGHLVLITGFDFNKKVFYIHNPSGDTKFTKPNTEIFFSDFKKFFAQRGIVING